MGVVSWFLKSSGRLARQPFAAAVVALYVTGLVSQALLAPPVMTRFGLWAFTLAQAILLWSWFALHAKRLRDGGRGVEAAAGITIVCSLAVVLFLLVLAVFGATAQATDAGSAADAIGMFAGLYLLGLLVGAIDQGSLGIVFAGFALIALAPVPVAIAFSIWAGTRPSIVAPTPAAAAPARA